MFGGGIMARRKKRDHRYSDYLELFREFIGTWEREADGTEIALCRDGTFWVRQGKCDPAHPSAFVKPIPSAWVRADGGRAWSLEEAASYATEQGYARMVERTWG